MAGHVGNNPFPPVPGNYTFPSYPGSAKGPTGGTAGPPGPLDQFTPTAKLDPTQAKLGLIPRDALKPGSLVVVDNFLPPLGIFPGVPPQTPHGVLVESSAREAGFRGKVLPSEQHNPFDPNPFHARNQQINTLLRVPGLKPAEFRKMLAEQVEVGQASLLYSTSQRLEGLTEGGLRNSAVNFSLGGSKASALKSAYLTATESPARVALTAQAFGLSKDKLLSEDPKVSGPERLKLQQALADMVSDKFDNSTMIKATKGKYDQAVAKFEANHNSVVVSAGNEGDVAEALKGEANGLSIQQPKGFYDSVLVNPQVTTVGALDGKKVAGYSTRTREVDLYANGNIHDPNSPSPAQGTSFSSPRVAALMAELHRRNPHLSSAQVEALVRKQMTQLQPDGDGVPSLDVEKTRAFLESTRG